MIVSIYVYHTSSGLLSYSDTGDANQVVSDLLASDDFTLTPPPNYSQPWYWYNNKWQSEPKPTP